MYLTPFKIQGYNNSQGTSASQSAPAPTNPRVPTFDASKRGPIRSYKELAHPTRPLHHLTPEQMKNYKIRGVTSEAARPATDEEVIEYLQQVMPGDGIPRHPSAPCSVELQRDDIVWYQHADKTWHLARVKGHAFYQDMPVSMRGKFRGKRTWTGETIGLDPRDRAAKNEVYLCPEMGTAKPYNWYTRLMMQIYKLMPSDTEDVERRVRDFEKAITKA